MCGLHIFYLIFDLILIHFTTGVFYSAHTFKFDEFQFVNFFFLLLIVLLVSCLRTLHPVLGLKGILCFPVKFL